MEEQRTPEGDHLKAMQNPQYAEAYTKALQETEDEIQKAKHKRNHPYNRKCQDYIIFLQLGPFNFSIDCPRKTKHGAKYCKKHEGQIWRNL